VQRHAEFVEYRTVDADVERLIRKLKLADGSVTAPPATPTRASVAKSGDDEMRAEGRIKIDAMIVHGAPDGWFRPRPRQDGVVQRP
jgi:hypothetical protein